VAARSDDTGVGIEGLITSYAASHPNAADTLEGVHAWWVGARVPGATRAEVEMACLRLVEAGVIERTELPDGVTLYVAASDGSLPNPVDIPKPN
jgi:hypothetical protein